MPLDNLRSLIGLFAIVLLGVIFSTSRKSIRWRTVIAGLALQIGFGFFVLKTRIGIRIFQKLGDLVNQLISFAQEGALFVFGGLATPEGGFGFIFAFQVLPSVIFMGALMAVLYHVGVMQQIVRGMAWIMRRVMGVSGAESLAAAANVFVGQTEAPLVVRPYLEKMTRSELMSLMTGGFATIAGAVLVAYTAMGLDPAHLLTASVMSAPAALVIAKLLVPETEAPLTTGAVEVVIPSTAVNVIDAAAQGTTDGLKLALNVGAMLVAFVALMFFADAVLVWFGDVTGLSALITSKLDPSFDKLTLGAIFGYIFRPLAWLIGVPWEDAARYGTLIGTQLTLTEFVAYLKLAEMIPTSFEPGGFSPRATMIATYGLCAFANVGSIGIQLGGIGALVESRRGDLAKLAVRAMLAGILAANMTAAVAGALVTEAEADFRQARSIARLHLGKGELEAADDMLLRVAENRKDDRWGQRAGALAIQVGSLAEQIQAGEITSDQAKARVE